MMYRFQVSVTDIRLCVFSWNFKELYILKGVSPSDNE